MKKGSIVGLIVVILVGIGLYKLYLYYPTWSAEKEAKEKMEREELIELANSEMKYVGYKYQEFDNSISLIRSADGNDEGDYYLIDFNDGVGKCYLTSKEQINAICKLDFEETPEGFNSEPLEVEKSQSRGMDCIKDVYDSKYDRTFKKIIYDENGESTGAIYTIVNQVDKTSWLEDNGKYVYDDLFGGNMLESRV
ncbi:MAG TPA: hypothetical protein VJ916_01005 [Anaerovoracaceae bacterium]|nr:hypothetical protein [Anaerovoracaceae bacterium]